MAARAIPRAPRPASAPDARPDPLALALALMALLSLTGALSVPFQLAGLARRLRGLRRLEQGPLRTDLRNLTRRLGAGYVPRLYLVEGLRSPLTFGLLRPDIYVPAGAAAALSRGEQRALLAHELSHVLQRDPLAFTLATLLERTFFFQPLLRLARRRLLEAAEEAADEWALVLGVEALTLASCLHRVAGWISPHAKEPRLRIDALTAPALGRSRLARRIERLLEPRSRALPGAGRPRCTACAALALLGLTSLALPRVSAQIEPRALAQLRIPPPAPPADVPNASASGSGLAQEQRLLQAELEAFQGELSELRQRLVALGLEPRLAPTLERLENALHGLEQRHRQLESGLERLAGEPDPESATALIPALRQPSHRRRTP